MCAGHVILTDEKPVFSFVVERCASDYYFPDKAKNGDVLDDVRVTSKELHQGCQLNITRAIYFRDGVFSVSTQRLLNNGLKLLNFIGCL